MNYERHERYEIVLADYVALCDIVPCTANLGGLLRNSGFAEFGVVRDCLQDTGQECMGLGLRRPRSTVSDMCRVMCAAASMA